MEVRRLEAAGPALDAEAATRDLVLADLAPRDRPYLVLNMVSTADGRATIGGRTGPIGNRADRELFHRLRTKPDAILVGARTAAIERYGGLVRDPALRQARGEAGLAPDPLACIVSGRLNLPSDVPLLQDERARVLIVTASDRELDGCRAHVEYLRAGSGGVVDLDAALARLRDEHGVRSVLCEGGPALNSALLRQQLVDELFLSLAAKLTGEHDAKTIVSGLPLSGAVRLELLWLLRAESDLFLRYRVVRSEP